MSEPLQPVRWTRTKTAAWLNYDESAIYRICRNAGQNICTEDGIDILAAAPVLVAHLKKRLNQNANTPGKKRREEAEADRSEIKAALMARDVIERDIVMAALRDWQAEVIREVSALGLDDSQRDRLFEIMRRAGETAANGINLETAEPDEIQD